MAFPFTLNARLARLVLDPEVVTDREELLPACGTSSGLPASRDVLAAAASLHPSSAVSERRYATPPVDGESQLHSDYVEDSALTTMVLMILSANVCFLSSHSGQR